MNEWVSEWLNGMDGMDGMNEWMNTVCWVCSKCLVLQASVVWFHCFISSSLCVYVLILTNNSQSYPWSIAWMGGGALRYVCGRRQPGQLRLERCCGWLFHHMGRKRVPVSYGSNRKEWRNACVEELTARNLNWCFALVLSSAATRPTSSGWIPTWPMTTLYSKANLKSLRRLCKSCQPSSCNICVTLEVVR